MTVGNSVASTGTSSSTGVLAIAQTHRVTAQGTFTVSVQVANPASVHYAFFTFCQLSSPVCYTPVEMNLTNSNWFVGTTRPMTSYPGMRVGVSAGFNITLEYPNNLNVTEPALPNAFANLTVANSVSGEFFFEMTVNDQVYALGGIVHDAATGARLSDASVTLELAPGDNNTTTTSSTGSFSFAGVPNGTYQMAVSAPGYASGSQMVRVDGNNVLTDVPLTHAAKASPPGGPRAARSEGFRSSSWGSLSSSSRSRRGSG